VKFTDREGKIMILVENQSIQRDGQQDDFVRISITDTGIGIKKKN
jgi:signal transduction histidine kinase